MKSYRITLLVLFLAAGWSLLVLGLVRKTVDVDVNVRVRHVSFRVSDERAARLFNSVEANSITVSRFQRIDLGDGLMRLPDESRPRARRSLARQPGSIATEHTYLTPEEIFANISLDAVTLNRLEIPRGARASLSWDEAEPNLIKVTFDRGVSGEIAGGSQIKLSCTACRVEVSSPSFKAPLNDVLLTSKRDGQVISFQGQNDATIIAIDLIPKTSLKEHNISNVGDLDFFDLEEGRSVSSIIDGKVQFEGVEAPVALGEGAFLKPDHLQNGVINTIWFDNGINLHLSGRTKTLLIGPEGNLKNKTPTVLEWIYAQHKWILALQTLTLVISSVLGVLSWVGGSREREK